MKVISADFVKSAFKRDDYPPDTVPEVAFAGKSNVGKSSLMNTLVNRKGWPAPAPHRGGPNP